MLDLFLVEGVGGHVIVAAEPLEVCVQGIHHEITVLVAYGA